MPVVPDDDLFPIWQRDSIGHTASRERPCLGVPSCVLVKRSGCKRRADRIELSLERDQMCAANCRLLVPLRDVQSSTQYTGIGWLLPLSSIGGQAVSRGADVSACFVSSVMRICPASAAEQSR